VDSSTIFKQQTNRRTKGNNAPKAFVGDQGLNLVFIETSDTNVLFEECIFQNNVYEQYAPPNLQALSKSIIGSYGSNNRIELRSNCFIDNAVVGFGLVSTASPPELTVATDNAVTPLDSSLECDFIAHLDLSPSQLSVSSCQSFDTNICTPLLVPTVAPSPLPTPFPTTPAPTPQTRSKTSAPSGSAASSSQPSSLNPNDSQPSVGARRASWGTIVTVVAIIALRANMV